MEETNTYTICAFMFVFFMFLIFCCTFIYLKVKETPTQPLINKSESGDICPIGKVCLTKDEYKTLVQKVEKKEKHYDETEMLLPQSNMFVKYQETILEESPIQLQPQQPTMRDDVYVRDQRVLHDQLYPPLNRIDAQTHQAMNFQVANRNMYVPLNDIGDSYRLVGYLTSDEEQQDKGGNSWKLFARQKDRHTSDFYIIPANRNYDIKIPIKDNTVVGTRLRDVYTIPNAITFNSPFLHKTPYTFIENSKTDYSSSFYS